MEKIQKDLKKILLAGIAAMALYIFLHEMGHCIAVWLYGGRITGLQGFFLYGHVSYEGDAVKWKPLVDLAGSLVTTLTALCLLFTYRRESGKTFVYYLKTIYICESILFLGSWISMSIMYLSGCWSSRSDEQKFILKSGISPVAVIFAAAAVILLMAFIFIKKLTAAAPYEWQKKNVRNVGIWLGGILLLAVLASPLFMRLDARPEAGGAFRATEKDGSPESILKKQYEVTIEDKGIYILNAYWSGSGFITGVILSLGDEEVFHCTAEKTFMETAPMELESGTYTFSVYCLNSMEDWEEFFDIADREAPELDYSFRGAGKYVVRGGYDLVQSF